MTGTTSEIYLGLLFELYSGHELIAAISREDVKGAAVPRAGERLGIASLSRDMELLVGPAPQVHHIAHYLSVPGPHAGLAPLCMVVFRVHPPPRSLPMVSAVAAALQHQGWHVHAVQREDPDAFADTWWTGTAQ